MNAAEILRAAAEKMRSGYVPEAKKGKCGCFYTRVAGNYSAHVGSVHHEALVVLQGVVGTREWFGRNDLERSGWTEGCTRDAVAALLIAADLATESP